jgi:exportin-1
MTRARTERLRGAARSQFSEVFGLCRRVLDGSRDPGLVGATLEALLGFLPWMPPDRVFGTGLADVLATKFLGEPLFR